MKKILSNNPKELARAFKDVYDEFFRSEGTEVDSPSMRALEDQFAELLEIYGPERVQKLINSNIVVRELKQMDGQELYNFPEGDVSLRSLFHDFLST